MYTFVFGLFSTYKPTIASSLWETHQNIQHFSANSSAQLTELAKCAHHTGCSIIFAMHSKPYSFTPDLLLVYPYAIVLVIILNTKGMNMKDGLMCANL